jgi:hypothetical protein
LLFIGLFISIYRGTRVRLTPVIGFKIATGCSRLAPERNTTSNHQAPVGQSKASIDAVCGGCARTELGWRIILLPGHSIFRRNQAAARFNSAMSSFFIFNSASIAPGFGKDGDVKFAAASALPSNQRQGSGVAGQISPWLLNASSRA